MNTAVPSTRGTFVPTSLTNNSSGKDSSRSFVARIVRPFFQVAITTKITTPIKRGSQPPCGIFVRFEARNVPSTTRSTPPNDTTLNRLHPNRAPAIEQNNTVVVIIVIVTATP